MIVWNNTDSSLEIVAGRCQGMGMQIKPQQKRKCHVSLEPGSTLEVRDGDETLTKVVVDDQVSNKHDYLVPVAVGVPMVVVDYSQFYVVDSTLDRLFADPNPTVQLVADLRMEKRLFAVPERAWVLGPTSGVPLSVPAGEELLRIVPVPPQITEVELGKFIVADFQAQIAKTQASVGK